MRWRALSPVFVGATGASLAFAISIGAAQVAPPASRGDAPATNLSAPATVVNPGPLRKTYDRKLEFAVFNKNCTHCHVSVADPERPGKTRDEWYRIVVLMQSHGLTLSQEEADMIVDLLFQLRTGIEEQAG